VSLPAGEAMRYVLLLLFFPIAIYAYLLIAYCSDLLWYLRMREKLRKLCLNKGGSPK